MSDIPSFPYSILWGERVVRSVANLTRRDAEEILALAPKVPVRRRPSCCRWPRRTRRLAAARGRVQGAAVLVPGWLRLETGLPSRAAVAPAHASR